MIQWKAFKAYVEKTINKLNASGEAVNIDLKNNIIVNKMRNNQYMVYVKFGNEQFMIISEPTGSGKSTTIKFVFAVRLINDPKLKLLIAVPQSLIAKSFGRTILEYPDGRKIEWDIGLNLCQDIKGQKSDRTINFLNKKRFTRGIHNRTGIVTHYGLALSLSDKSDEEIVAYFKNTTLIIDEAHHVLYPEDEEKKSANILGRIISVLLEKGDPSTGVWLPTATYYRGDSGPILSNEQVGRFKVHHLPFDQHWRENIKYIDTFEFNFVTFDNNTILNSIDEILKKEKKKTIIYCPYKGHTLNGKSKMYFKNRLIYTIKNSWPDAKICDLVKITNREEEKEILFDDLTANDVDAILTVRIFDEGSDWKYAELAIDLMPSSSLRVQVQRLGRLWRDIPGKNHIAYYVFLPHRTSFKNDEKRRKHFSDSYNALAGSMLIHEIIKPVKYPDSKETIIDGQTINALDFAIPNLSKRQELLKDVQIELVKFRNIKEPTIEETKEKIKEIIYEKHQIDDKDFSITNQILGMIKRSISNFPSIPNQPLKPSWKNQGIDLTWMKDAGYDKVEIKDIYDQLLMFGTMTSGVETFEQFREVYGDKKSIPEWVVIAEELAKENNGILYHQNKLIKLGFKGLTSAIVRHPTMFEHIQQENNSGKTVDEWVVFAEELAKENNEVLPSPGELLNANLSGLVAIMSKYPKRFRHIKQKKQRLKLDQIIKLAEKLAKENNGLLPNPTWLRENGYGRIIVCMGKYKKSFKHINQEKYRRRKTIMQHIETANNLAKGNNGKLPSAKWLLENGYGSLCRAVRKRPDKFKHLQRDSERKSPEEWVKIAKELAKKNEGVLPSLHWLNKNGFSGLPQAIDKHPNKFKNIKLNNPNENSPEVGKKWVKIAKVLAKKNGGVLPKKSWLMKKGYGALVNSMYTYPNNFKNIKQDKRKIKTINEHVFDAIKLTKRNKGILPTISWLRDNGYTSLISAIARYPKEFKEINRTTRK